MATLQFICIFPSDKQIDFDGVIESITSFGYQISPLVNQIHFEQELGLVEGNPQILTGVDPKTECLRLLENGIQLGLELIGGEIPIDCTFAHRFENPFFYLSWPRRTFRNATLEDQRAALDLLLACVVRGNGKFVVFLNDTMDGFEERFIEVDGRRVFSKQGPIEGPVNIRYDVPSVWVAEGERVPDGLEDYQPKRLGSGFIEYFKA